MYIQAVTYSVSLDIRQFGEVYFFGAVAVLGQFLAEKYTSPNCISDVRVLFLHVSYHFLFCVYSQTIPKNSLISVLQRSSSFLTGDVSHFLRWFCPFFVIVQLCMFLLFSFTSLFVANPRLTKSHYISECQVSEEFRLFMVRKLPPLFLEKDASESV